MPVRILTDFAQFCSILAKNSTSAIPPCNTKMDYDGCRLYLIYKVYEENHNETRL